MAPDAGDEADSPAAPLELAFRRLITASASPGLMKLSASTSKKTRPADVAEALAEDVAAGTGPAPSAFRKLMISRASPGEIWPSPVTSSGLSAFDQGREASAISCTLSVKP